MNLDQNLNLSNNLSLNLSNNLWYDVSALFSWLLVRLQTLRSTTSKNKTAYDLHTIENLSIIHLMYSWCYSHICNELFSEHQLALFIPLRIFTASDRELDLSHVDVPEWNLWPRGFIHVQDFLWHWTGRLGSSLVSKVKKWFWSVWVDVSLLCDMWSLTAEDCLLTNTSFSVFHFNVCQMRRILNNCPNFLRLIDFNVKLFSESLWKKFSQSFQPVKQSSFFSLSVVKGSLDLFFISWQPWSLSLFLHLA